MNVLRKFHKLSRINLLLNCSYNEFNILKPNVYTIGQILYRPLHQNEIPKVGEKKILSLKERLKFIDDLPASIVRELVNEYMQTPAVDEWQTVKSKAFEKNKRISEYNFSGIVLRILMEIKDPSLAKSFFKYLDQSKKPETLLVLSYRMAHLSYFESKDKEEAILKVYDQIKQLDTIYDSIVLENIICGLSTTSSWSEGLELVKSAIVNPSHQTFLYLITAAFKNGDFATGLGYFPEICANSTLSEQAELAFLDSLEANSTESNQSKINIVNDFCQVLGKTGIISTKNIITKLKSLIHSLNPSQLAMTLATISEDSKCSHCWKSLHPKIFTAQEFNELREAVLKNLVMEKNIFMNTTPAEFKNFVTFINRNKPFDVVFDGLNLLYCQRHERKADMRISLFVNHYATREKKKVLVLGRNHMNKLNYKVMEEIRKIAHVYLLQNVSQDDAMFIYAAMMSGPQTYILTKDMLRNHLEKMPTPELKQSFSAWQATRQIIPAFFPTDTKVPPPHLITAQGSLTTGLHVPYGQAEDCYDYVKSWLCVQPK